MPDYVFCGLCGHRAIALFEHLRQGYQISVEEYEKQCPGAPLFSREFGRFIAENDLSRENGSVRMQRELFGVGFARQAVFDMSYLPGDRETHLLQQKIPSLKKKTAQAFVKLANAVRRAADQEQVFCTFSTRRLLALARKSVSLGNMPLALEITVLNKLAKNDRQVVYEIAQRHLPELESENGGNSA